MTAPKPKCNIGERPIQPLGRGPVLSPVVQEEIRRHKAFVADMAVLPKVVCGITAKAHRTCLVKHAIGEHKKKLVAIFNELGLAY